MYYVYIIKRKREELYIGYTSNLDNRLKQHNVSKEDTIYYEAYKDKYDATMREQQLKEFRSSWGQLKKRIIKEKEKMHLVN